MKSFLTSLLVIAIALSQLAIPVFSQQERPVVISFGQPNIWSFEQAHYLLARMHRQNLDLQTAPLGDLDANAANASRIDILKTLLEAGVEFDQAVALNNELLRSDKEFNSGRRQELLSNRSTLQAESTQLARQISALKIAKANAKTDDDRLLIQAEIDAKTEEKAAVDNQIAQTNDELEGLAAASGDFKKADASGSFNSDKLKGDLDALISKVQLINPSIAATLRLDNHVQMQYEIIAKQLTLLRDEVGPGERLVFLELPQSINATQDKAENKIAQTWWRIAGYTTVDREKLRTKELDALKKRIDDVDTNVTAAVDLHRKNQVNKSRLRDQLDDLCEERARRQKELNDARAALKEVEKLKKANDETAAAKDEELCKTLIHDISQLENSINQLSSVITDTRSAIQKVDDQALKLQKERARLAQTYTALTTKYETLRLEEVKSKIKEQQYAADRLLQGSGSNTSDVVSKTIELLNQQSDDHPSLGFQKAKYGNTKDKKGREYSLMGSDAASSGREYVNLDQFSVESEENQQKLIKGESLNFSRPVLRNRAVRTIDIIPRQNAVNVNDTKERVSKTGIFAAVSFLFGFGGKFGYERQHEQAEQFLNQELFTSGFGKGETDFGWNFYPFAGTKHLAPGIRTTYAIAIIPEGAESIVLKARGCYFPRKENQPLNYDMAGSTSWTNRDVKLGNCTPQEQVFVLPIPGGSGDGADFYITEMRFSPHRKAGERLVASIYGQNLPSQIGVLINGVALTQSVGLAQTAVESILGEKVKENCFGQICGRFERIDSNQIVLSFSMPPDFTGLPRISLVGPGKAVEINKLHLNINGEDDVQLDSSEYMFGKQPSEASRSISDFKVAPAATPNQMTGVLSGGKFKDTDTIYVNGEVSKISGRPCERPDLCLLKFPVQSTDFLTVTVSPADKEEEAVSRTFANPTTLSIISASIVSSEEDANHVIVLTVRLDGSGFKNTLDVRFDDTGALKKKTITSPGQMILEITKPSPIVSITLQDSANNKSVSTVVVTPPLKVKEK